jgi:hypothetical protein
MGGTDGKEGDRPPSSEAWGSDFDAGSPEYSESSLEYPAEIEDAPSSAEYNEERFARADQASAVGADGTEAWWKRAGYATFGDYLREAEQLADRYDPFAQERERRECVARAMPATWAPAQRVSISGLADDLKRSRQVGVKLTVTEDLALTRVAALYGAPRAVLARMLINRGVQSVIASLGEDAAP